MKVNALYVGNGTGDRGFVQSFVDHCTTLAMQNIQIALSALGLAAIYAKKRAGHNVLFVDFDVIADDIDSAKTAIGKFVKKIPNMPVFVLCTDYSETIVASVLFGTVPENIFFCDRTKDIEHIYEKMAILV